MARIKPFSGLRFTKKAGETAELCCPPYDIISEEQRIGYLRRNPHNIIRLELPKEGENPYKTAGETLNIWLSGEILKPDSQPAYYVYREEFDALGKRMAIEGLICLVKLEEFEKGVVLPHEETLSKAKTDRFNLMKATGCNFSQIYSLYMDESRETPSLLARAADAPALSEYTDEAGIRHSLWAVTDPAVIEEVTKQFENRKLYIADGHHRYETALNYRNYLRENGMAKPGDLADYVMMFLCDMQNPGLVVYPTHRIVHSLEDFDAGKLLKRCEEYFEVSGGIPIGELSRVMSENYEKGNTVFGFYNGGDSFTLLSLLGKDIMEQKMPDSGAALRELDVSVLHTLILDELLGIDKQNMAQGKNLRYTRDMEEALTMREGMNCAFLLNPTRVDEICAVALEKGKMPQKSTYFYPKLTTGMVMNRVKI
ncbi:MAG TPA: DUF1015 domain-containing protein [Ruminococcaceae bacterium]|nr:DUF1015 domain-containing protein [Oscillospiraceae bacterium]